MMKWNVQLLLAAGLLFLHYIADGKDDTTLRVCEGSVANFTNDHETTGHDRLIYSFKNKTGHATRIYEIETPGKEPTIPADYIHRFNRTSFSEVGFALNNARISDEGNYMCFIIYSDGSQQRFAWTLQVEDSRKLNKPKIQSKKRSGCIEYNCSLDDDAVEVDMYWSIDAIDRRNGSSLVMCEKNSSELIVCIIESFCDKTSEYDTFKKTGRDLPASKCITDLQTVLAVCLAISLILLAFVVILFYRNWKRRHRKRQNTKEDVSLT